MTICNMQFTICNLQSAIVMIDKPSPSGHLLSHVLAFTYLLREMSVDVSPGQALELVRALEYVPITDRENFRSAARCTLICRCSTRHSRSSGATSPATQHRC